MMNSFYRENLQHNSAIILNANSQRLQVLFEEESKTNFSLFLHVSNNEWREDKLKFVLLSVLIGFSSTGEFRKLVEVFQNTLQIVV